MLSCPLLLTIFSLEESLFHVFHQLLHTVNVANKNISFPRVQEFFTYAHQQIIRRAALERELAGLPELVPLDPVNIRQSLGPGYKLGWYAFHNLAGRKDNCKMEEQPDPERKLEKFDGHYRDVMEKMQQIPGHDLEAFALEICDEYHGQGHINVGELCPDGNGPNGLMTFSECSAR